MTENIRDIPDAEVEDTALIVDFLQGRLDPEKVALVRRRLDEDEKFRDDVAPLILAWTSPTIEDDKPLPPGELEKNWDKFSKAAGFVHQKKKARLRTLTIIGLVVLVVLVVSVAFRQSIAEKYADIRDYEPVPMRDWVATLPSGARFELKPGSSLRIRVRDTRHDIEWVKLTGAAHVLVLRKPTKTFFPSAASVLIETTFGAINTMNAELHIETHGDSTWVDVMQRRRLDPPPDLFDQMPDVVVVQSKAYPRRDVLLRETDRAIIAPNDSVVVIKLEKRP